MSRPGKGCNGRTEPSATPNGLAFFCARYWRLRGSRARLKRFCSSAPTVGSATSNKKTASPGPIAFARSLPLQKAIADSTLLAYAMNDGPLTHEHGHPLRAVVGGWFGMAWVKWITHIRVLEQPFLGYWQARDYFRWERGAGEPMLVPLTQMEVKAQIARPVNGANLIAGRPYRIFGAAWSGEAAVRQVQVYAGDGEGWREARLLGEQRPYAWRLWEYFWTPRTSGDTGCGLAPPTQQDAINPTRSSPIRELCRQLDRSRGGRGRARTRDLRGRIRHLRGRSP